MGKAGRMMWTREKSQCFGVRTAASQRESGPPVSHVCASWLLGHCSSNGMGTGAFPFLGSNCTGTAAFPFLGLNCTGTGTFPFLDAYCMAMTARVCARILRRKRTGWMQTARSIDRWMDVRYLSQDLAPVTVGPGSPPDLPGVSWTTGPAGAGTPSKPESLTAGKPWWRSQVQGPRSQKWDCQRRKETLTQLPALQREGTFLLLLWFCSGLSDCMTPTCLSKGGLYSVWWLTDIPEVGFSSSPGWAQSGTWKLPIPGWQ